MPIHTSPNLSKPARPLQKTPLRRLSITPDRQGTGALRTIRAWRLTHWTADPACSAQFGADEVPPESPRQVIDAANNRKLLRLLDGVEDEQRTARFICCLALCDGTQVVIETCDSVEGVIGHEERGENGFGYDPLFYIPELGQTTAQLPPQHKNSLSHRGKALRKFKVLLGEYIGR